MTELRRADPTARRTAALVLVVGTCAGALLITAWARYRVPLGDWVLADRAQRVRLVFLVLTVLASAPLLGLAIYLWSLGGQVVRSREYPPPGLRVLHDTSIVKGEKAIARARLLRILALGAAIVSALFAGLLWRLEILLSSHRT